MASQPESNAKLTAGVKGLNQQMKERDVQEKAKSLGLPYVNLLAMPINPDLANTVSLEQATEGRLALFFKSGKRLRIAVMDPEISQTKAALEALRGQGYDIEVSLCSDDSLEQAHKIYFTSQYQKKEAVENVVQESDLGSFAEEIADLQQLKDKVESSTYDVALNYVQVGAYKSQSTDVHFQPEESHVQVRFRIDGVLKPVFQITRKAYDGLLKEIKHLSHLKLNITETPQDGQYSFLVNERQINVRVSILPTHYGEACVMRLLDSEKPQINFEELGFEGASLAAIQEAVSLSHGIIMVTGPTGSGKTTTLYSMLQSIDTETKKVITLEDPIEYNLPGISQSQVDEHMNYGFADGLRAILRQDPDIIMVGEIRDLETAETAAQASLTGHLVFSTLHTNSAIESIPRLVNMGLKAFVLAPALNLIVAQRLVRKLCEHCVEKAPVTDSERSQLESVLTSLSGKGIAAELPAELPRSKGCDQCGHTGFKGQVAIAEVLRFDEGLRNLILESRPIPEIAQYIQGQLKMASLLEDGILKVLKGVTTLEEVYRVAA